MAGAGYRELRSPEVVLGLLRFVDAVVDDIVAFVRDNRVDEIIIALPWTNKPRLVVCIDKPKTVPMTVRQCSDTLGFHFYNRSVSHIGGVPMFNLWEPPLSGWSVVVKAAEDRILATLILLLALPTRSDCVQLPRSLTLASRRIAAYAAMALTHRAAPASRSILMISG